MSVKCYETDYKNYGKCLCLDNGIIKLIATIDVGPRIVFFGFTDGDNVLFEDIDRNFYEINNGYGVWYAYGGHRIWSAPEVMPETYLPDNSKVEAHFDGGVLTLTGAEEHSRVVVYQTNGAQVTALNNYTEGTGIGLPRRGIYIVAVLKNGRKQVLKIAY